MESEINPHQSESTATKQSARPPTPAKPQFPASADQIETPEKPPSLSLRVRNRRTAFSVKEVSNIALGLQTAPQADPHRVYGGDADRPRSRSGSQAPERRSRCRAPREVTDSFQL